MSDKAHSNLTPILLIGTPLVIFGGYYLLNTSKQLYVNDTLKGLDVDFKGVKAEKVTQGALPLRVFFSVVNPYQRTLYCDFINLELRLPVGDGKSKKLVDIDYVPKPGTGIKIEPRSKNTYGLPVSASLGLLLLNLGVETIKTLIGESSATQAHELWVKGHIVINGTRLPIDQTIPFDLAAYIDYVKQFIDLIKKPKA